MHLTKIGFSTLKEDPADAEIVSHKLMLRAGLIKKLSPGIFTWMPIGLRVIKNVESIVREEMNKAGGIELLMPAIQPAELWKESGRWDEYGSLLLQIKDRHDRDFCFGPTHEEVITDIARKELKSYKQLPIIFYQIQTKFRDEIRPRFGVMRSREFIMKDAYSFHANQDSLDKGYNRMHDTYSSIFTRLKLKYRIVDADGGEIGGSRSQEFHVIADSGEDAIAYCEEANFASNIEMAETYPPEGKMKSPTQELAKVKTPGVNTIEELCKSLNIKSKKTIKTLIVEGSDGPCALVLRGDHELNALKASKLPGILSPLKMSDSAKIEKATGKPLGSLGPINLGIKKSKYENIIWMDADFQHPPDHIKLFHNNQKECDVAFFSRFIKGSTRYFNDDISKKEANEDHSIFFNKLCNFLLYKDITDYTSGFICIKRKVFENYKPKGYYGEYFIDLIVYCKLKDHFIIELPFVERQRLSGNSKTAMEYSFRYLVICFNYFFYKFKINFFLFIK